MKKTLSTLLLLVAIFSFTGVPVTHAADISISQFVELLITIGVISPDQVIAARTAAASLSQGTTTAATSSLPYVQILAPNGGESWDMNVDVYHPITWGSSSALPVIVSLVSSKGAVCNLNNTPIISKSGSNNFSLLLKTAKCFDLKTGTSSPLVDGSYKARVSSSYFANGTSTVIKDDSDASFTVLPIAVPSLKITYPNGGEKLTRGNIYEVKYTLKDTTASNMIYGNLIDPDGNIFNNVQQIHGQPGIFEFKIGQSLTEGAYKVQLRTIADNKAAISDSSDNFFWIANSY